MFRIPIYSTNFEVRSIWDGQKIPFALWTFLVPCIYGDLDQTENRTRNRASANQTEKGQNHARTTRSEGHFFMNFSDFLAKTGDFMAQRAYICQKPSKSVILADFSAKLTKKQDFGLLLGPEEGSGTPENDGFLLDFRPPEVVCVPIDHKRQSSLVSAFVPHRAPVRTRPDQPVTPCHVRCTHHWHCPA